MAWSEQARKAAAEARRRKTKPATVRKPSTGNPDASSGVAYKGRMG